MLERTRTARPTSILLSACIATICIAIIAIALAGATPRERAFAASDAQGRISCGTIETIETSANKANSDYDKFIGLESRMMVLGRAKTTVTIYATKSLSSRTLGRFTENNCIVVNTTHMKKNRRHDWLRVKLAGGLEGFVVAKNLSLFTLDTKTFGLDPSKKANKKRIRICRFGLPYIGTRWVGGGTNLSVGVSCNAFAWYSLNASGLKLSSQVNSLRALGALGKPIKRENLKPGDLVFYGTGSDPSGLHHVAIYIGKGMIINSSGAQGSRYPAGGIRISQLDYRYPFPSYFRSISPLL